MNLKFSRYDVSKLVFALSDASKNVKRAKKTHVNFSNKLDSPKVMKVGIEREKGWLYFIDKEGDISRSRISTGKKKVKKTTEVKKLKDSNAEIIKKLVDHIIKLEKRHSMIARGKNEKIHTKLEKKIKDLKVKLKKLSK